MHLYRLSLFNHCSEIYCGTAHPRVCDLQKTSFVNLLIGFEIILSSSDKKSIATLSQAEEEIQEKLEEQKESIYSEVEKEMEEVKSQHEALLQ